VRACREQGFDESTVPGPSAITAALCVSGLPPYPFAFLGFPPRTRSERVKLFSEYAGVRATLVFFERKTRLLETLEAAHEALGPRELCVCRELTKTHEEIILTRLENWDSLSPEMLGEMTVVVGPPEQPLRSLETQVDKLIARARAEGLSAKAASKWVKERSQGWTPKEVYERITRHGSGQ